jgi:AraC-like DNA-binding protein
MNPFMLLQGIADELQLFPHIIELSLVKNASTCLNTFPVSVSSGINFFYILDGKFQWYIHNNEYSLYPGDVALILPRQKFGSISGKREIGSYIHLEIYTRHQAAEEIILDKWSRLHGNEIVTISKILFLNSPIVITKSHESGKILKILQQELLNQEVGYFARVNHHIDDLFILITRQLTRQNNPGRDFTKTFIKLEGALRDDLSHQWTVDEMAALAGLGTTLFNEKVKNYSGFTPLNYLINIRISEAIKLLKKKGVNITDIALDTGFSSSQHFSTTFKKLTGFTPSEFRKNNFSTE